MGGGFLYDEIIEWTNKNPDSECRNTQLPTHSSSPIEALMGHGGRF